MKTNSSANAQIIQPQWMVLSGHLVMNSDAVSLQSHFNVVNAAHEKMSATYAGAVLLQTLLANPWLQSAKLNYSASSEYDDEGGSYRSIALRVTDVQCVPGADLSDELCSDGHFLSEVASKFLYEKYYDDGNVSEVYEVLNDSSQYSDLTVEIDRSKMADLLADPSAMSGLAAFRALFPDHLYRIGEQSTTTEALEAIAA